MRPEYEPLTRMQKVGYLVEECGETMAAVGKLIRWGSESINPELKPGDATYGQTNREWLLAELDDLERAIGYVRAEYGG